ncbi:TetR/AcrR family transcriptional regulator [Actinokineospora pegani]|uniref:TetR/AcrR family transcriptional regulator n=1 Tax=Actinokineospora pegani TaxID=2654637 RepID=UPI0018D41C16|nr:TetR/AcrR family transcriptional regulator [Actinokineospora pegani]
MTVPDTPYQVRRAPTQYRASRQIERILDAASRVVTEKGFVGTTTADIAKSAKVSIGSVYRYFPDKIAVMKAVVERNSARYLRRVDEETGGMPPAQWRTAVEHAYDIYVDMCRTDDGFRALSGAGIASGELESASSVEDPLSPAFAQMLVERFGFPATPDLRTTMIQVVTIGDVMSRLAFRLVPGGHVGTLVQTRRIIVDLLVPHGPL